MDSIGLLTPFIIGLCGKSVLGKFLVETMMQMEIDCFLKLSWFNVKDKLSFSSAQELLSWMDLLPPRSKWQTAQFEVQGYTTATPIHLIWCDGLEVTKSVQREYGEWFTANQAFLTQDQLPEGATIMPIIAASDKTPVTRQMGGLEMHPLFLTISNIDSDIRMKATSHAWQCVVYIPIPKFETHPNYYHTILKSRVWHKCVDLVFASLKITAKVGEFMPDPFGELRYCFTPLSIDPWNLDRFQKKAKELFLLGIHLLFWFFIFLVPEILHPLHKFFFNHLLQWCKELVGSDELDACYKSHHKCIGVRHFSSGISYVVQMTRQEHRDIQHTINPIHTDSSIEAMQASLDEFHNCKVVILEAEARQGKNSVKEDFYIPKLELLLSFSEAIRNNGGLVQFTADVSEWLLIMHCKSPFTRTSKQKDFMEQIVHILDREEQMQQFNLYLLLHQHNQALIHAVVDEDEEVYATDTTMAWVSHVAADDQYHYSAPRPIHNHFIKGILSNSTNAALTVTRSPDGSNLSWPDVMHMYGLPDLHQKVTEYVQCLAIKVWSKFCIQLHSTFRPSIIMPIWYMTSQAVQAEPPSDAFPSGNCDAIFLDMDQGANNPGFSVAQVCIIFQLTPPQHSTAMLPGFLSHPLLYVQPFHIVKTPKDLEDTQLWMLKRVYPPAMQPQTHTEFVIPITEVTHSAELVPVYGERVDRSLTSATSQEHYDHFYLNRYADKEHQEIHTFLDIQFHQGS
ncbi:hypothetical protein BDR07DRAFT_1452327 [Suillus spraguei]|nr:hypothetical protein BDR07DRAFT_1452327 [Suillus spraguei]